MHRRSLIQRGGIAGMAGIVAAGIAPAVHAQAATRWRLASSFPATLDILHGGAELFARRVGEMTGGRFQIDVHAAGELMPALGVLDGVQQGAIEACHTSGALFAGKDPVFAIGSALPFGMSAAQCLAWTTEGNGQKLLREFHARFNLVELACGSTGSQTGAWFLKEIRSVAGFKGLKFATGGLAARVAERLGARPQAMGAAEARQALARGTLGAAEGISPYDDQKLGFQKATPHCHRPGWWGGASQLALWINQKAFDALSAEYKAIVQAAGASVHLEIQARYDARNAAALRQLAGAGVRLKPFPRAVLEAAFKASTDLFDELDASNPAWKKIHADYRAFQKDQVFAARYSDLPLEARLPAGRS